ncbi:MAG: SDR family oxidoreductase [Leptospiraceae bacterium]|nr:SDR family oxidoreductase [Leptospiraceae bacterium]
MKSVLITGANRSIGFETARQFLRRDFFVFLGSRDLSRGLEAAHRLRQEGLNASEAIQMDVSDDASVEAARRQIGNRIDALDVLVNNAGISGGLPQTATEASLDQFQKVFDTNLFGVVRVTQAFVDLMRNSTAPRIVNVSSSMGSLTLHSDPSWKYYNIKAAAYLPSKSALNMYTITLAYELRDTAFKVNVVDPGFIATDFNNFRGTGTVQEAADRVIKLAMLGPDGPSGQFFSEEHDPVHGSIPW